MSTITSVKLWYDTGYTEGSSEIPPVGHTLGTPDLTLTGPFTPAKGRLFSELQVKESYTDLMNCSYLEVELELNNGLPSKTFYGWIDDISISSDNTNYPMTVIKWHVDLWRTFNSGAEYGSGFVVRRASGDSDFFQNFPYRYKRVTDNIKLLEVKETHTTSTTESKHRIMWVIIAYVQEIAANVTRNVYITYPVYEWNGNIQYTRGGTTYHFPDYNETFQGEWDEFFGIDPERITGCWLSPIAPFYGYGTHDYVIDNSGIMTASDDFSPSPVQLKDEGGNIHGAFYWHSNEVVNIPLTEAIHASETVEFAVYGASNEIVGYIPFSRAIVAGTNPTMIVKVSPTDAMIELRFGGNEASANGLRFDIILPSLDLNENSWSSYAYSGQREYDKNMRRQNSEKGAIEGGISGTGSGAIAGALVGGPIGAAVGGVIGLGSSLISSGLELGYFNDKFQDIEDRYHAARSEGIITSGFAKAMFLTSRGIGLFKIEPDGDSQAVINDIKTVQGVKFNAPVADCTSLITTGGPLQITNLIVKGDIPVPAKKWIKQKFADGVRIVSR